MGTQTDNRKLMVDTATALQQEYYELFAEWTEYKERDYPFLKQNIGYSIYGPPKGGDCDTSDTSNEPVHYIESNFDKTNFTEALRYEPKAQECIDMLYGKICDFGKTGCSIYYGLIYNVTFPNMNTSENVQDDTVNMSITPIFKIRRQELHTSCSYEVWYIDISGRIYKSWDDYKTNNTLPQCTMVLPKNGFYHANPEYDITEKKSVVWLEIEDSPACRFKNTAAEKIDLLSTLGSVATLGVVGASFFTPIGPLVAGAAAATGGVSGLWAFGRSTSNLIDRSQHEQSISLNDRDAFASWLGVTGSATGLALSGGTILLSKAVQSGNAVSTSLRLAYNTALLSNLGINGIGVGFQAYNIYDKYQTEQRVDMMDMVFLSTHILFMGNAVVNFQFAGDLITSTQGKILDDYKSSLRSKRLRKAYNRASRAAAENNANVSSERAEVIRYINNKKQFSSFTANTASNSSNIKVQFTNGTLSVNGVVLLDPVKFAMVYMRTGSFQTTNFENDLQNQNNAGSDGNTDTDQFEKLKSLLALLLNKLFSGDDYPETANMPTVLDFIGMLKVLSNVKNSDEILRRVFSISEILLKRYKCFANTIVDVIYFIWKYLLSTLKEYCAYMGTSVDRSKIHILFLKISGAILEIMDDMIESLFSGLRNYLSTLAH